MAETVGPEDGLGARILEYLTQPVVRERMVKAAEAGSPPAASISAGLVDTFGLAALDPHNVRRFIGYAVRSIMADAGYEPLSAGVRVPRDPLFSTAATYKAAPKGIADDADSLLKRFIESLSRQELSRARFYIDKRLGPADE